MQVLTIFSIPKPFAGHIGVIQRNAITSWTRLNPRPDVILLGDEEGTAALAMELGVRHIAAVQRNEFGTPLLPSVFGQASAAATTRMLCYVNADIILTSSFMRAVSIASRRRCLVVGHRTNLDLNRAIDFTSPAWESELMAELRNRGQRHSRWAMDYFLFPCGLLTDIPPFAIGRLMWDNWLVANTRARGICVADATPVVTAIHQNHGYSSPLRAAHGGWNWDHPEARRNLELAGGHDKSYNLWDCSHVLTRFGMWPALGAAQLRQRLERRRASGSRRWSHRFGSLMIVGALKLHGAWRRFRSAMSEFRVPRAS